MLLARDTDPSNGIRTHRGIGQQFLGHRRDCVEPHLRILLAGTGWQPCDGAVAARCPSHDRSGAGVDDDSLGPLGTHIEPEELLGHPRTPMRCSIMS